MSLFRNPETCHHGFVIKITQLRENISGSCMICWKSFLMLSCSVIEAADFFSSVVLLLLLSFIHSHAISSLVTCQAIVFVVHSFSDPFSLLQCIPVQMKG